MKILFVVILTLSINVSLLYSQEKIPQTFQGKYHMLSPDEFQYSKSKDFISTEPPSGMPRSIAEFEPNQGVIIGYPYQFGIPLDFIKQLSEDVKVYLLTPEMYESSITSMLTNAGTNMNNVEFVNSYLDGYWTRDYSPLFIEYGEEKKVGIVDFPYNRPRVNDDNVPYVFGDYFDMDIFGMNLVHTGGNYMTDGLGVAASCDLVYTENPELSRENVAGLAEDFLGITKYHLLPDPLNDYIEHIDCWGKFLDVDKILITKVPGNDYRYADFEAMADYWANQESSYGNKYKVYRVYSPNGQPYTNSLIVNNKVYVPIVNGTGSAYNSQALEIYEQAMPGYEIIGISHNTWETTDALHCRTHEVPDFQMLRISHIPLPDSIMLQNEYEFSAEVYTFNNYGTVNSVKLFLNINNSGFIQYEMNNTTGNEYNIIFDNFSSNDNIQYYIQASTDNSKTETHPYIGINDPHSFFIKSSLENNPNISESYIKAYPNPASGILYLIANELPETTYMLEIYDQQGAKIKGLLLEKNNTSWNKVDINITDLSPGLYFIKATGEKTNFNSKFIKL